MWAEGGVCAQDPPTLCPHVCHPVPSEQLTVLLWFGSLGTAESSEHHTQTHRHTLTRRVAESQTWAAWLSGAPHGSLSGAP